MHDCNPLSEASSCPTLSWEHAESLKLDGWTGAWSGDVQEPSCYITHSQ